MSLNWPDWYNNWGASFLTVRVSVTVLVSSRKQRESVHIVNLDREPTRKVEIISNSHSRAWARALGSGSGSGFCRGSNKQGEACKKQLTQSTILYAISRWKRRRKGGGQGSEPKRNCMIMWGRSCKGHTNIYTKEARLTATMWGSRFCYERKYEW